MNQDLVVPKRAPAEKPRADPGFVISLTQTLLSLMSACRKYLKEVSGWDPSKATVKRWATRGINGIPLPTIKLGSKRYTSKEALAWWFQAIAASHGRDPVTPPQRKEQIEQAAQRLRAQLGSH